MPESLSNAVWRGGHHCSIEHTLDVVGDRWSFLVLRQVLIYKMTRFSEFESSLGIAPNILADRLEKIVAAGILEKRMYQEPGLRPRFSYHCTPSGEHMLPVLGALQQWGDEHAPDDAGPSLLRRSSHGNLPLRVAFVDDSDTPVALETVTFSTPSDYRWD